MKHYHTFVLSCGVLAALLLLLFPAILPSFQVHLIVEIFIFSLFALSFNLMFGYGGLLPFGHGLFFGIGAYSAALIFNHLPGTYLLLTILISSLLALVAGFIEGLVCARLRATYFALISLAFQMFVFAMAVKWRSLTGGDDGMGLTRPDLYLPLVGDISMTNINNVYYFVLILATLSVLAMFFFLKTPLGNALIAMKENENRASFLGYSVFQSRLTLFSVAGFFAGLAGALFVFFQEFVAPASMDMDMSFSVVLMVLLGGASAFLGPVLGASFFLLFKDWASSLTDHWWLVIGLLFVIVILYVKGGLISLIRWEKIKLFVIRTGK